MFNEKMDDVRFVYCETCGKYDKAWFVKPCIRKKQDSNWKSSVRKNKLYFGYKMIQCIEEGHTIKASLTYKQLTTNMKKGAFHGFDSIRSKSVRSLARLLVNV